MVALQGVVFLAIFVFSSAESPAHKQKEQANTKSAISF